jgi:hypothetical protein
MLVSARSLTLSLAFVALGACNSKVTSTLDPDLQKKVSTVNDCVPPQIDKLNELLDYVDLWRLNGGNNPPDPAELSWALQGDGTIDLTITLGTFTITSTISFYSPTGALQNLAGLSTASLSQAIDDAATQLAALFLPATPFMVGEWTITGANVSGSGAFTGLIGGSTNGNELEELRTTTATPAGGPPPVADGTVTTTNGADTCVFTFNAPSIATDTSPSQQYPIGTVTFSLVGPEATIDGTLTFDDTVIAKLTITGVSGHFDINLDTLSVTFVP